MSILQALNVWPRAKERQRTVSYWMAMLFAKVLVASLEGEWNTSCTALLDWCRYSLSYWYLSTTNWTWTALGSFVNIYSRPYKGQKA